MAFDLTNPDDLLALQTEVNTDPIGMGYTPNSTNQLLKQLNDPANNVGGETTATTLTPRVLRDVVVVDDLSHQQVSAGDHLWLSGFIHSANLDEDLDPWRLKIREAFRTNSDTVTAIDALQRPLSRAEVLFGNNTSISRNDWIAARAS